MKNHNSRRRRWMDMRDVPGRLYCLKFPFQSFSSSLSTSLCNTLCCQLFLIQTGGEPFPTHTHPDSATTHNTGFPHTNTPTDSHVFRAACEQQQQAGSGSSFPSKSVNASHSQKRIILIVLSNLCYCLFVCLVFFGNDFPTFPVVQVLLKRLFPEINTLCVSKCC